MNTDFNQQIDSRRSERAGSISVSVSVFIRVHPWLSGSLPVDPDLGLLHK
jgi:hypothetical protein